MRGQGRPPASADPGPGGRAEGGTRRAEAPEARGGPRQAGRRGFSWRTPVAVLLIVAGCVPTGVDAGGVDIHRRAGTWAYTHRHARRIGAVALAALISVGAGRGPY